MFYQSNIHILVLTNSIANIQKQKFLCDILPNVMSVPVGGKLKRNKIQKFFLLFEVIHFILLFGG